MNIIFIIEDKRGAELLRSSLTFSGFAGEIRTGKTFSKADYDQLPDGAKCLVIPSNCIVNKSVKFSEIFKTKDFAKSKTAMFVTKGGKKSESAMEGVPKNTRGFEPILNPSIEVQWIEAVRGFYFFSLEKGSKVIDSIIQSNVRAWK